MFGHLFYLWRFAGIAVYADTSLFFLVLIWLFLNPGQIAETLVFSILLFGSITLHEFGHSLTARRLGYNVDRIVLNILGGAAVLDTSARKGSHEFLIAIAGPAVSVVLGTIGYFIAQPVYDFGMRDTGAILFELGIVNFYLSIFNLMPAFPLDGGRVFRSILTPHMGLVRATAVAARVGRALAIFVGTYSVLGMLTKLHPIRIGIFTFQATPILLMIAVYVYMAADAEYRMVLQESYENRFRWGESQFREGDGDAWKRGSRDISRDVEVSPPPFERGSGPLESVRRFFRRLFKK